MFYREAGQYKTTYKRRSGHLSYSTGQAGDHILSGRSFYRYSDVGQ